ncbi:HET-domain-containing protein [Amniculicola lignicola CBS 123094]|uniref:HET-domain-containing protein n=1 Tax=Amniculicola lignicola CBS 123094 TaxID=1392246 RepID=A0A6A5W7U9_9PLEO|nr:HET-domain-containing protein [Amniculicola lignicola CBS 123094]
MRLLRLQDDGEFSLVEFFGKEIPPYAILSHTWGADGEEFTFKDLEEGTGKTKAGYSKIRFCGKQAADDNLQYFWVDTCCINKSSSAELSEAINSMYQWYKECAVCYAYLADVIDATQLTESRWFTRGWTLQELIAPAQVVFFNANLQHIGTKHTLVMRISQRTGIPKFILQGTKINHNIGVAHKIVEDMAYCLLGVFDVNMPLLYGEGLRAFNRLQEEILRQNNDPSLLAWP